MALKPGISGIVGLQNQSTAESVDGSLKFNSDSDQYLSATSSFADEDKETLTIAFWLKRHAPTATKATQYVFSTSVQGTIFFDSGNDDQLAFNLRGTSSTNFFTYTLADLRDFSAWTHVVVNINMRSLVTANRFRCFINGVQQVMTNTSYPQNYYHNGNTWYIGAYEGGPSHFPDFSLSNFYCVVGQALGPEYFGFTDPLTNTWRPKKYKNTTIGASPTLSNGALIIRAKDASIKGQFISGAAFEDGSGGGNLNFFTSSDGSSWTRSSGGRKDTISAKYLAAGGAGISPKTFIPNDSHELYEYYVWNDNTNFDSGSDHTTDVTSKTFIDSKEANFGANGFHLPFDGNSPIGEDQSGNGNNWTPVNFNGSVPLDSDIITGGRPILNTTQGGAQAGVGVFGALENKYYTLTGSSGSGSGYVFENEGTKPTLSMIRGVTYTFDYSAASSHPFRFATAADAAGSTQYTTGTSVSGNVIKFTVPHDAPATLHYYCTNHGGMGNSISVTTDETKADKYASNIVLAVPMAGSSRDFSGSINATQTSKAFSNNAGTTYTSKFSNFYSGSGDFTTSSDVKRIDYTTSGSAFGFGTDDFTIEWWMYATENADGNHYVWDTTGQKSSLIRKSGGGMTFETYGSSNPIGEVTILSSGSYNLNKWAYWAVVRDGDNVRVYIDGVLIQTTTGFSGVDFGDADGDIGGYHSGGAVYNADAHLQDFRIYKGVAKYTGTSVGTQYFTVPSRSPDILPDTPSGSGAKSQLTKITDGAVSFEGTATSKLTLADSTDFTFGTNDFCIEFYYYNQSLDGTYNIIFDCMGSNRSGIQLAFETDGDYRIEVGDGSSNWIWQSTGFDAEAKKWTHFALTREGSTFRAFEDGVLLGTQTSSTAVGDPRSPAIGGYASDNSTNYGFDGFISNFRIVNGSAVYIASFTPSTAPLTNITNTKLLCCQSNTSATEGAVKPGTITAVDAAATNFNPFTTDINTVRGQETGYCTLNPLVNDTAVFNKPTSALSDGNLTASAPSGGNDEVAGTIGVSSGKWYFELTNISGGNNTDGVGIADLTNGREAIVRDDGAFRYDGSESSYSVSWQTSGDVIGVKIDLDNSTIGFFVNGVYQGDAKTNLPSATYHPFVYNRAGVAESELRVNFGQKPFKFPPPDGFQPLNTANTRPKTVTSRPDQFVGVTTYRGNSGTQHINVGMSPDLVWIKERAGSKDHNVYDTVRGVTKELFPNGNGAENTLTSGLTSFNSNGYTFSSADRANGSGRTYVNWFWKAGGNKNTFNVDDVGYATAAAAGITEGTLSLSGASIGTKQGFSICKYTSPAAYDGSTWGHGLSQAPDFIISRMLNSGGDWSVYHSSIPTKYLLLNSNASQAGSNNWTVTSTTVTMGAGLWTANSQPSIAYHWHDVPGLQKFGSYTCNGDGSGGGNEDGPYVELGFRPAMILFKGSSYTSDWTWIDDERCKVNYNDVAMRANYQYSEIGNARGGDGSSSQPENYAVDLLSNGFKIRASGGSLNSGTNTVTYAAWARSPFSGLYGGDATAR